MEKRSCYWCNKTGHLAATCPAKKAGKAKVDRPAKSLDYEETMLGDRDAGSIGFEAGSFEIEVQCGPDFVVCGECTDEPEYDGEEQDVSPLEEEEWGLEQAEGDYVAESHVQALPPTGCGRGRLAETSCGTHSRTQCEHSSPTAHHTSDS